MSGQCANPPEIPVLITRPEPQASRFAAELTAACPRTRPILAPLMQVEFLPVSLPHGPFAALVLTSETAAEAAGRLQKQALSLPKLAFCVGDRTARAARRQGFEAVSAEGAAEDLVALIVSRPDQGCLLWLRGQDYTCDLGAALAKAGRRLLARPAYRQNALPLAPDALAVLGRPGPVILPLFSPRSARLVAAVLPPHSAAEIWPVAISPRALSALPPALQPRGSVAEAPDGPAMIRAIVGTMGRLAP
jgi:uroporphyrinogen-III synthase